MREPDGVKSVAIVGGGVIGAGWAAHFLARGLDVSVFDPAPGGEARLRDLVRAAWPTLESIGLAPRASQDRLSCSTTIAETVAGADFVQECAPDDRALKRRLFAELDGVVEPDVVIASSTSGIPMTEIQQDMAHPERAVVGHPFNPPYLVPLVEVVPGAKTSREAAEWAVAFYDRFGKKALLLESEQLGFVANRLQEAIWREALHMIAAGEATVEQIDAAIVDGPGLRWAVMGPCLTFHLGGGEGGIAHMLRHFEAALSEPWCRMEGPRLTDALCEKMERGCRALAAGASNLELIRHRDQRIVAILKALNRLPEN